MAEFNFKFSNMNYETESNGQKIKMPLIRVECNNEDFYKTVNWQDGKNPFAQGQKYFYVNGFCDICDDKGNVLTTTSQNNKNQHDLYVLRDLNYALLDDGYRIDGKVEIEKYSFINGNKDRLQFEIQSSSSKTNGWQQLHIYINENGFFTDAQGEFIDGVGDKLTEAAKSRPAILAFEKKFLSLARKNKVDFATFRYVAKEQKFGEPEETAIYHFVKENFKSEEPEQHIYLNSKGYEVDQNGKRKLINNQPYLIWNKPGYENFRSLAGVELDENGNLCLWITFNYKSNKLKLGNFNICGLKLENNYTETKDKSKKGFTVLLAFDYGKWEKLFIDEKDGKIYDLTGEHLKKIDLVHQKIIDADENTCSKITDPELYGFMKTLIDSNVFKKNGKVEYEVADKPEEIAYSLDKKDEKTGNVQVADYTTNCIRVKTKLFGQQVGECFIDLEDDFSINEVYERKDGKQGMGYCSIGSGGVVVKEESESINSNQSLFKAVRQKGYLQPPEFIIKDDAKNSSEYTDGVEIAGQKIKAVPVTFKMVVAPPNNVIEKELLVSEPYGYIYRVDKDQDGNKEFVPTKFDDLGNFSDGKYNVYHEFADDLHEALYQKGFLFHKRSVYKYYIDPEEQEIEITDPEDNTKKKKITCRRFVIDQSGYFVDINTGDIYNSDKSPGIYKSKRVNVITSSNLTISGLPMPDVAKVLEANGMKKMRSGATGKHEAKEFEIKSDKAEQIKIGDGDDAIEFEGYKFSAKLDDDQAPKILYLDKADGSICDENGTLIDFNNHSLEKLLKALNLKKLFVKTFEVSDEQNINNHVGHIVEVKVDGLSSGQVFVETPSGDMYDKNVQVRKAINWFYGALENGEANVNNYDYLPDLKKALMAKGANLPKDRFDKDKIGKDGNKDFKLKLENPNEEIYCYVAVDGFLKILDKSKKPPVYTKKIIDLNGVELGETRQIYKNKFLPMMRRYLKESEIKNLVEGYRGGKFEDQPWYTQPNQVFKEIKFPNKDKEGDDKLKFELKVTTGPEDDKNLEDEQIINGFIDEKGYLRNDKKDFIDINGNVLTGPAMASLQPEIKKILGDEWSKNLPSLEITVDEISGREDLLKVKIKIQPGNEDVDFCASDDGFVYEKEDKQTKMKLIIDNENKTAELKKLEAGEDFNLLLKGQDENYLDLISKIRTKKTKFLDGFIFPLVEVDKNLESKIFAFKSGTKIYYVDKATYFFVNKNGEFIDNNDQPIDLKDKEAFKNLYHAYLNNPDPDTERKCKKGIFIDQSGKIVKNLFLEEPILIKLQKRAEYFKNLDGEDKKDAKNIKSDIEVLVDLKKNLLDVLGQDTLNKFLDKFDELNKKFETNKEKSGCKNLAEYIQKEFSTNPVVKWLSITFGTVGTIGSGAFAAILILGLVAPLPTIIGLSVSGVTALGGIGTGLFKFFSMRSKRKEFEEVEYNKNENGKEKNERVNVLNKLKDAYTKVPEKENEDKKDGTKKEEKDDI